MSRSRLLRHGLVPVLVALALIAAACGDDDDAATTTTAAGDTTEAPATTEATETTEATDGAALEGELVGVFAIDTVDCADAESVSGSYFRMVQQGGTLADGPFVPNGDSVCGDPTYTPLGPGTDGGFVTGAYQPAPDPAFDDAGNGLAAAITEPTPFFAVAFAVATAEDGAVPSIVATGGQLSGDLSAWTAYYGDLVFNQGAPKPDGSMPGLTTDVTGTIDSETGAFVLDWSSEIVGGAFNGFTGVWHLEGTFSAD